MPLPILPILLAAGGLGKVFGGAAKGQADERANQNAYGLNQNAQDTQRFNVAQDARTRLLELQERGTMDRAKLGLMAPQQRAKQALLGSLLQNMQKVNVQPPAGIRMGTVTGGLNMDAISAAARGGGGELQRQALAALASGSDIPGQTDFMGQGTLSAPGQRGYRNAGRGESILSILGLLGSVGGASAPLFPGNAPLPSSSPISFANGSRLAGPVQPQRP